MSMTSSECVACLQRAIGTKGVLADRAYDATSLRQELAQRRVEAVIPPNPTRKHTHRYSKSAYKGRNVIETYVLPS
jgi:IS5 family transposase